MTRLGNFVLGLLCWGFTFTIAAGTGAALGSLILAALDLKR